MIRFAAGRGLSLRLGPCLPEDTMISALQKSVGQRHIARVCGYPVFGKGIVPSTKARKQMLGFGAFIS